MKQAEEKFYRALKDVFVGAQVEGESGYINLKAIRRLTADTVTFEDGTEVDLHNPPWELVKSLI